VDDPIRRQLVRISVTTMSGRSESALFDSRRASPKRWNIESVDFDVETVWGFSIARGRFDRAAGSYVTGREGTKIDVMVDAGSVVTGNELLDNLLRSPELSELAEHPGVRFTSTRIDEQSGGTLHVRGELNVAGKTRPVEFDAVVEQIGDQLRLRASTTVDKKTLAMSGGRIGMLLPAVVHIRARLAA
jgi:polyisoprenoid-binding protein YceI